MNLASSDIFSGVHGGSNVSSLSTRLDAGDLADDAVDVLLDHLARRAAHRRERVQDLDVRPVDLGFVEETELDDVHPELWILNATQRFDDLFLTWHDVSSS